MATSSDRVPVIGSERTPLPGARPVGPADPQSQASVTIVVRPQAGAVPEYNEGSLLPRDRTPVNRDELAALRGADPADIARVEAFARDENLTVVDSSAARRVVVVSGTVADLSAAFDVQLSTYEHPGGTYRGRTGPVKVPAEIVDVVQAVLGLDDRPQAEPHFRAAAASAAAPTGTFTPPQVARLYNFPTTGTGTGQTVAIIELGGGYVDADLTTYFGELGITPPKVTAVSVDGGQNTPSGNPGSADGEVMLDIEIVGAVAPGANIVVYFAPNSDQGFLNAITSAVHDTVNNPSVISISWGTSEPNWTAQALQAFDQAFQDAAHAGVTVCAASGDNGSADRLQDGLAHVDYPSADPYVLGCGGTTCTSADGTTISSETVWNDGQGSTGGGISDVWSLPSYQSSAGIPPSLNAGGHIGRGVPDVAGDADPATGWVVRVDGQEFPIGGTSAVAPLWAGLIALVNEQLGTTHAGFINPLLYAHPTAFHDITGGNNDLTGLGGYSAGPGWDACTGLGTPDGTQVLAVLSGTAGGVGTGPPSGDCG